MLRDLGRCPKRVVWCGGRLLGWAGPKCGCCPPGSEAAVPQVVPAGATGEYRAEAAALELLLEEAAQKGDPVLARHPQAVENYFVCYLFSGLFPMLYHSRGLTLEENGVLLAEQYALLRMLLAILPAEEGETEEQRLIRSVVALARITQHSDLGGALRVLRGGAGMDEMTQVAYLLR